MNKTILIVDDEKDIIELLKYNLQKEGYGVITARDGAEAISKTDQRPGMIILDVMMPGLDGWEIARRLKKKSSTSSIPIIFLTAKSSEADEVLGLELGADDYIVKPISIPKLLARIRNVFRKHDSADHASPDIRIGGLEISPVQHMVKIDKAETFFPKKEFEVLHYLAMHANQVINRDSLLASIWGNDVHVVERTVDVHIRKIREKLGKYAEMIETIKGVGYRMRDSL